MYRVYSPAKINLWLEILGRRSDGYHNLRTVFQSIALFDEMEIELSSTRHELCCEGERIPCGEDNIVLRTLKLFLSYLKKRKFFKIKLKKRIPVGRGLGGGSSNAAVLLLALNRLFENPFSLRSLLDMAKELGADVPFFLFGGRALGLGRGDEVYPLEETDGVCVLIDPGFEAPTGKVYGAYDRLLRREENSDILEFLWKGEGYRNDLFEAALEVLPQLKELKEKIEKIGYLPRMTGSGSAFYLPFEKFSEAEEFYDKIRGWGVRVFIVPFLNRKNYFSEIFKDWGVAKR